MLKLIKEFENRSPELVYEWKDNETGAEGWLVINSLRGGAAGGGTRMRKGLDKKEVVALAKTMEIKFSCCGPMIGGAKSGINFDPSDPRKNEVLDKWFKRVVPILKSYYGTGGDMNVDQNKDVIPITSKYGLQHPQEGVLTGFYNPDENGKLAKIKQLQTGVSKVVEDSVLSPSVDRQYRVADLITGYGVSEAVRHTYEIYNHDLRGKSVVIQGWGNVGAAAAYYLTLSGANIKAIIDRNGGIIDEKGMGIEDIRDLFLNKNHNELVSDRMISFGEMEERFWDIEADIFIPAAASNLVGRDHLKRMQKAGISTISCGANVPFADEKIFFGSISKEADKDFSLIPDFIANSGMARAFAYLMQDNAELSDKAIFNDVSEIIRKNLMDVYEREPGVQTGMYKKAMEMAIEKTT